MIMMVIICLPAENLEAVVEHEPELGKLDLSLE